MSSSSKTLITLVINIRNAPPGWQKDPSYVYIGRPGKGVSGEYGNPHRLGWCEVCSKVHSVRGDSLLAFADEARHKYASDEVYRSKIEKLRGKKLVCFCAPKPCHGRIYLELLGEIPVRKFPSW